MERSEPKELTTQELEAWAEGVKKRKRAVLNRKRKYAMNVSQQGRDTGELSPQLTMKQLVALNPKHDPSDKEAPRRKLRELRQRERELGVTLLWRKGTGPRSHYTTTLAVLKMHCSESIDFLPALQRSVTGTRGALERVHDDYVELLGEFEELVRQLGSAHRRIDRLLEMRKMQGRLNDDLLRRITKLEELFLKEGNNNEAE